MFMSMRDHVREALIATAMFGSIGAAFAQAPAPERAPLTDKENAAKPFSLPDQNAKQEPSAKQAPATASGIFDNGKLAVPGASADTSTTPAKFSQANDQADKIPIMARGPVLSDAQRKLILDRLMTGTTGAASRVSAGVTAGPAMGLPSTVDMQAWPPEIAGQVPSLHDTKYVKLQDKILVVRPDSWIVIGEIGR